MPSEPQIFRLSDFQFPDSAQRLYPDTPQRPWVLEVGFGDGRFWPHHAATFTEAPNYLGVELSGVSLLKAYRRLRSAGLSNAILTKLPADVLVREVIPDAALDAIIVNFPDPWPKAGHTEHRLLRAPFFELAARRLKARGQLLLTTDHEEYFQFALAEAGLSGAVTTQQAAPPAAALETKYAQKWRDLGLPVYHARFTPAQPLPASAAFRAAQNTVQNYSETNVPHAILTLPPEFAPHHFEKYTARHAGYTAVLLDLYASLRRDGWVCLAHVVEGALTQEVLVGITVREDGSTLVRLSKFGGPIITEGVKGAVGAVTDWLVSQGAVLTHRGY